MFNEDQPRDQDGRFAAEDRRIAAVRRNHQIFLHAFGKILNDSRERHIQKMADRRVIQQHAEQSIGTDESSSPEKRADPTHMGKILKFEKREG
jgi:hypothetical protein